MEANNWTEICVKCMAGDIEPHYCEYYGEQNGCNSPTCGEHPPTPTTPNTAAMREAVDGIRDIANSALTALSIGNDTSSFLWDIIRKCEAVLAVPPRNCDVGTAEEQCDRFLRFCQSRGCVNCEIGDGNRAKFPSCELVWAQMPYKGDKK